MTSTLAPASATAQPNALPTAQPTGLATGRQQRTNTLDLSATPATRNRAIDAYRAIAMCAVAFGHWLAADVRMVNGSLAGANALDKVPTLHILTWVFQVMPVFFCIGGFSNAASLDAHHRAGRPNNTWVRARLLRLTSPSIWLAGTWLAIVVVGNLVGLGSLAGMAAGVAAIPLWFLANYVADTALAPVTLRLYRTHGWKFVGALMMLFLLGEAARFPKIHYLPQINIVIGWLLFQVFGFAWKDGHLPSGRQLMKLGVAAWSIAGLLVAFGPWPLAMVSVPGAQFANTWPPSLALMFYGLGLCSYAIAAAPFVSRFLSHNAAAWKVVVVANTMTMTSYLWHFTALAIAAFGLSKVNLLPSAPVGSGAWWMQKVPVMGVALVILLGFIALLSAKERKGLTGSSSGSNDSAPIRQSTINATNAMTVLTAACGLALAGGFELWTAAEGDPAYAIPGIVLVLGVHATLRKLANRS